MPEYFSAGTHETTHTQGSLQVPGSVAPSCGDKGCPLALFLTCPKKAGGAAPNSYPLVVFYSGFQMSAATYRAYARDLASWGYVVLQYDVPGALLKKIVPDQEEIKFWPHLIGWVKDLSRQPGSVVYEAVDLRRVAVMGHSRGAKLAALVAAGGTPDGSPAPAAAVCVDPVDMTSQTRKAGYPSAVDALGAAPRRLALIGAGVTGWCNPEDEGWRKFWPALLPGSWRLVLPNAGHMQFTDAKGATAWAWDKLCGAGKTGAPGNSHKPIIQWTSAAAVAWLESAFRPEQASAPLAKYQAFIKEQAAQGFVQFEIKGKSEACLENSDACPTPALTAAAVQ